VSALSPWQFQGEPIPFVGLLPRRCLPYVLCWRQHRISEPDGSVRWHSGTAQYVLVSCEISGPSINFYSCSCQSPGMAGDQLPSTLYTICMDRCCWSGREDCSAIYLTCM
jgi:hypothetical protein